ncbi:dynein regulatory complex protein 9 isoform X2 [Rhineura floridana]|uniref:dynein regulatory complex protein 9 isoform X2 n=1 Tax=Rhineura floridana TaxID=261503 RepID=UPI002AC8883D|nr:dynein regulatory complex protein 9 isoform X2 [Rhineura floridana]
MATSPPQLEPLGGAKPKPPKLLPLDAVRFSAVLEDCIDQLAILGYIMPVSYEGRKDVSDLNDAEIKGILANQKDLSTKYKNLMDSRAESQAKIPSELGKIAELGRQLQDTGNELKRANYLFTVATKQSALSTDNLKKVQADRKYASDVIEDVTDELLILGTFHSLQLAMEKEKEKKSNLHNLVLREEIGRKKIKCLQKQLNDVKKEKDYELQNRNEMIAYLKDQLQEMKAKTDMENRYVKKDTELQVAQMQKKCFGAENDQQNEIEKLRNQTEQENRVHMDIENFLKQQQMCLLCEQAIIEDRKEKEHARKKVEQDALEMKSILKLQAWWRGMMVRRFLGPYKNLKKILEEEPTGKEKGKKGKGKPGTKKKK